MKSPIVLLRCLWDDFQRHSPDVKGLKRDFITLEKRFENEGYGFLTVSLPSLDDALLLGLSSGWFSCPTGFKTIPRGRIPRFLSGIFSEVFEPFTGQLKESPDEGALKSLREILRLFKKTQMSSDAEQALHEKAITEFVRCDDEAHSIILSDRSCHLIESVAKLILNDLNSKSFELMSFRHGPGAVEEGFKANQKWSALSNSIRNVEFDTHLYGYDVSLINNLPPEKYWTKSVIHPSSTDEFTSSNRASRGIARLVTVAKNSTSRRTITVEPFLNQFIQQGLNTALRDSISNCRILSNSLALSDQTQNQKLALEGSLNDNWATIDLKSASDLLSVKLVRSVFRHHDQFFDRMMDCRSTSVKCDNIVIKDLGKFAGMGNATTFPVQSVCFTVTCIAAILDAWGQKATFKNVERASRHIRVFGDDIIVRTEYAHQCVNWLHSVGLKVNTKKSFLKGNFKESCGVEAYKGVDITPLYLRHRPDTMSTEPSVIGSLVSTSNQAWMRGLYSFSTCLRSEVEKRLGYTLPLVGVDSGSLGWHSRQDAATPHKWCRNTHQFLTRTVALKPLKRRDRLDGYAALLKFFHVPLLGRDRDHLEMSSIRYKLRIARTWVPTLTKG